MPTRLFLVASAAILLALLDRSTDPRLLGRHDWSDKPDPSAERAIVPKDDDIDEAAT